MTTEPIIQIVKDLSLLMLPFLPYLEKGVKSFGTEFVKSAGGKVGESIPDVIKNIWGKIEPKLKETPGAENTVKKVVENPKDQRTIGAFELLLEDILSDEEFRGKLVDLIQEAKDQGITIYQNTHLGKVFGEMTNVDVEDASNLSQANIRSELTANEIEKGGKVIGVHIESTKKK